MSSYTKLFEDISKTDTWEAGGKGASLGEMSSAGIRVPPGYVVLTDSFEQFLKETDLNVEIESILSGVETKAMHTVEDASATIQALINRAEMPTEIAEEILEAFETLNVEYVAVRSSATAEDSASAAWAGQLDTFLNVTKVNVLERVQECWASLFTPRAIFYRFEQGLHESHVSVAVVIEEMVDSEKSGIAFSVHPVTEDRNQLIIEAGLGLGEAIVSGAVTPDSYVVSKNPREIIDCNVSEQSKGLYREAGGGNVWKDLSEAGAKRVLNDEQILELSELIVTIENHYGFPCDIEWAYADGQFYITQSRPITTLTSTEDESEEASILKQKRTWEFMGRWIIPTLPASLCSVWPRTSFTQKFFSTIDFHGEFRIDGRVYFSKNDTSKLKVFLIDLYNKDQLSAFVSEMESVDRELNEKVTHFLTVKDKSNPETLRKLFDVLNEYYSYWILYAGAVGALVLPIAREVGFSKTDADLFELVHPYLRETWIEEEQLHVVKIAKALRAEGVVGGVRDIEDALRIHDSIEKDVEEYLLKYAWVGIDKWVGEGMTREKLLKRLVEEILNTEEDYIETKKGTKKFSRLPALVQLGVSTAYTRANCAGINSRIEYAYRDVLTELAARIGGTYDEVVHLTPDELVDAAENPERFIISDEMRERLNGFLSYAECEGVTHINTSRDALYREMRELYRPSEGHESGVKSMTLTGIGASRGFVKGRVRVITSRDQFDTFEEGEILVAPETTPAFVPLMKKAAAILTEVGSITSHAAIVSREFQKPCVIGIPEVSSILKTGDEVEVDAHKGVVRILSNDGDTKENIGQSLLQTFRQYLGDDELFAFEVAWSPLFIAVPWTDQKFYTGLYDSLATPMLFFIKGRDAHLVISETKYRNYAKEIFEKFVNRKITIRELERMYQDIHKQIDFLYNSPITDPEQVFKEIIELASEMPAKTLFVDTFDKDILEEVLGKEVSKDEWEKATLTIFESFEYRWNTVLFEAKTVEEVEYIFVDNFLPKDRIEIETELAEATKKEPPDFIESNKKKVSAIDERWVEYVQFIIRMRDIRKDSFGKYMIVINRCMKELYPEVGDSERAYVCPIEVADAMPPKEELIKRASGMVHLLMPDRSYMTSTAEYTDTLKSISEYFAGTEGGVRGVTAQKGKATGTVRVITDPQSYDIFNDGDILVTSMTRPDFVPLMKRAGAVVTNEGGITCHAAIVSRELGVPCIIGTKNATKVLKDGTEVEVDADKGVVKVLERVKQDQAQETETDASKIPTFNKDDFILSFESKGVSFLVEDIIVSNYMKWESLTLVQNSRTRVFATKKEVERMHTLGASRTTKDLQKNTDTITAIVKQMEKELPVYCANEALTKDDVVHILKRFAAMMREYSYFDIHYTDGMWKRMEHDASAKEGAELVEKYKNEIRKKLEGPFFGTDGWLMTMLTKLSSQFNIPVNTLHWYRETELLTLFEEVQVSKEELDKRKEGYVFYVDKFHNPILYTEHVAKKLWSAFEADTAIDTNVIKGIVAHGAGKQVRGVVKIVTRDYSNPEVLKKSISEMSEGDILVSETTDPELMEGLRKAGAIVTDVGGMLSHAAISARELNTPCIIGTEIATKVLKDGL